MCHSQSPFEHLRQRMSDILGDGGILKEVVHPGDGPPVPHSASILSIATQFFCKTSWYSQISLFYHILPPLSSTSALLWFHWILEWAFWNYHKPQVPPDDEVGERSVISCDIPVKSIKAEDYALTFLPGWNVGKTDVTLAGMELSLLTMKKGEFSRFLFEPQYAFGDLGCPPNVPGAAVVLYEIHVIDFFDSGQVDDFIALSLVGRL